MDIDKLAGTTLGNYEIESLLGEGGMGVVYKARQVSLNRSVALKILPPALSSDDSLVRRFEREAHAVARLNHPNIVHIYDIGEQDGLHFFSMEYVDGRQLDEHVRTMGRLDPDEAVKIVSQAALAIEHAHDNGITHRDIKPSNIMIDGRGVVKVMDFGLARSASDVSKLTQTGTILGTLHYMSPEQCVGEELDLRTDIYSLGVVLYEMLAGGAPFTASNAAALIHKIVYDAAPDVQTLNPDTPPGLSAAVARAMAKRRDDRYASVSQFLKDINDPRAVKVGRPVRAGKQASGRPAARDKRGASRWGRRGIAAVLIAVLAVPLVAVLVVYAVLSSFDYDSLKTTIEQSVEAATGRELSMSGDIEIEIGLTPKILVENVRFQNAAWGLRSEMATLKRFELEIAVIPLFSRSLVVKRLILVEPDIIIETDGSGKSNLDFLSNMKSEEPEYVPTPYDGEPFELTFKNVEIENGRLTYRDGGSRKTYTFALTELKAGSEGSRGPIQLEVKGEYNGKPFEMDGTVGPLTAIGDPEEPWRLSVYAEGAGAVINLDGAVRDVPGAKGLDLNVTAEGGSIADIAKFAGISGAPDVGPYKIAARITDPAAGTLRFSKLEATLGDSNLAGSIEIRRAGERPALKATLTSQKLDLRPFLPPEGKDEEDNANGGGDDKTARKERIFSSDPLPLDLLERHDVNASIRARQVLLPRMALDDLSADVVIQGGTLVIDRMNTSIGGGLLDSRMELNRNGDMKVSLKIARLDIGRMLRELDIGDTIDGEIDADIELDSRGGSVAELMAGLNGTTIVMGKGRIKNKYIDLLKGNLGAGIFRMLNPMRKETGYIEFNCFVSRLDIADGLAQNTVLVADTDGMTVFGEGGINLKTEELDMGLKPSPKKGLAAQPGISLGVSELIKPFRLRGTLAEPKLALDPTLSPISLGKDVLGGAGSGAEGLLSGLLGNRVDEDPCATATEAAESGTPVLTSEKSAPEKIDAAAPQEQPPEEQLRPLKGARTRFKKLLGN